MKPGLNTLGKLHGDQSVTFRLVIIVSGIIIVSLFAYWFEHLIPQLEIWIKRQGAFAPLAFILLIVIATPLLLSVDALCLAAGVLFPLAAGSFYVIISTYLAASIIFFLGRYCIQDRVNSLLAKQPRLQGLDELLSNNGIKIMFLLRLLPLPFALISYAFSVTRVQFKHYIISTSGVLIYNIALVYLGYSAKHISWAASSTHSPHSTNYPLLFIGAIGMILILVIVIRMVRKKLSQIAPRSAILMRDNTNNI